MGSPNKLKETALWEALPDEQKEWPVVSHSRIMSWQKCKFQWFVRYVKGYSAEVDSEYLIKGNHVHEALASLYLFLMAGGKDPQEWKETVFKELSQTWFIDNDHPDSIVNASTAIWVIDRYISESNYYDMDHTILDVEKHFLIPLTTPLGRRFLLQGYIDLLTADEYGRVWAWDHKSGTRKWDPVEIQMDAQLPTYAGALREEGLHVFGFIFNQLSTRDYVKKDQVKQEQLFQRDAFSKSESEIESVYSNILVTVDDMLATEEYLRERGGQPTKSLSRDCKYCNLATNICSNNLRGIPVDVLIDDMQRSPRVGAVPSFVPEDELEGFEL